jgi:AcrR family transcriptional regulator
MPGKTRYSEDDILEAAFSVVRQQGWEQCTARSIAKELGSSTMPIYSSLKSMDDLKKRIVGKALDLMLQYQGRNKTHNDFLDMGLGYVLFAKEEQNLFKFMFQESIQKKTAEESHPSARTLLGPFQSYAFESLLGRISDSETLKAFSKKERESILRKAWIFSHGLAVLMNNGVLPDLDSDGIIQLLKETGKCLIEGALTLEGRIKHHE